MRQVILDTETTGLEPSQGHRIIEIGCVEMVNRKLTGNHYHQYIQPEREIEEQAIEVHGITNEFLKDKPIFATIAQDFLDFVKDSELVIHNAPFDIGFLDHELKLIGHQCQSIVEHSGRMMDTLVLARQKHPGQKNNLDALCKRYDVDNSQRDLHGALLDAEILADVYLMMTGGQTALQLNSGDSVDSGANQLMNKENIRRIDAGLKTPVIKASESEHAAHANKLELINKVSGGNCVWLEQEN
jgi:DNA polymerase-3 subunit epsilon